MAIKGYAGVSTTYTPVEYIESSGTQYIDTGIVCSKNNKFELDIQFTDAASNGGISGGYFASGSNTYRNDIGKSGSKFWFGIWNQSITTNIDADTSRHVLSADYITGEYKIDGVTLGTASVSGTATTTNNIGLLGRIYTSGCIKSFCFAKLYGAKIYVSGNLARDFIPAVDGENKACLYDLVEGKLYYSETGDLAAGNVTGASVSIQNQSRNLIKMYGGGNIAYTPIEYIESTGTQFINTLTNYDRNTKIEMKAKILGTSNQFLLGARTSSSTNELYMIYYASDNFRITLYNSNNSTVAYSTIVNKQATILFDTSTINLNIEGTDYNYTASSGSGQEIQLPIYLFACNTNYATSLPATMQLYSFKLYKNNALVRDFIPVLDENNVACLLDMVENKAYYNQGTGNFVAGNTTGEPNITIQKTRKIIKGYVGINGQARLCYEKKIHPERIIQYAAARGYAPGVASTENHIIVAGGGSSLTNYETWDKNYTKTTVSKSGYYKDCIGRTFDDKTMWIFSNQTAMQMIYDNLTTANGGNYSSNTSKYGMGGCRVGNYVLFTGGVGGASSTAIAYNKAGTATTATTMYSGRYRHAQCNFNGKACILGGGSARMDVYSETLVKTNTTGLSSDQRYINSEATKNYMICGQNGAATVAVFDTNLVRQTALTTPTPVGSNCIAFKEPHGRYIGFSNNTTNYIIYDNLTIEKMPPCANYGAADTYATAWLNEKVVVAGQNQMEIFDT